MTYEIKLMLYKDNNTFDAYRKFYDDYYDEDLNHTTENEMKYYKRNLTIFDDYSPMERYEGSMTGCCSGPIIGYFNIPYQTSLVKIILNEL